MKDKREWIYEDMEFIKIDGEVYVKVDNVREKLVDLEKAIKKIKKKK